MKDEHKILLAAAGFGAGAWFLDAVFDYIYFPQGTFLQILLAGPSPHQFFMRTIIFVLFLVFGAILSAVVARSRRTAESLRAANTFTQTLLNSIPYGIEIVDETGTVLFLGNRLKEIFGDAVGKKCWELYRDEKTQCLDCPLRKAIEIGRTSTSETRGVLGGKIFQISHTGMIFQGKKAVLEIFQDITYRKSVEERVQMLQENLRLEKLKLEQVLNAGQEISSLLKLNDLVDYIIKTTTSILGVEKCSLMFLDDDMKELVIKGASGLDNEIWKNVRVKLGSEIAGRVALDGKSLLVHDVEDAGSFSHENRRRYKSKSFLSVPIKVHNRVVGVVNVADRVNEIDTSFNKVDLKILETIVRQSAVAIENANYFRQLEYLSTEDSMTNVYNYRYFVQRLDTEIARSRRYKRPLSLLMIDIDDFKAYNDRFGHPEGDRLLKEVSAALKVQLRSVDTLCRYAGDEFVIILPETEEDEAQLVGEKLRCTVANLRLKKKVTMSVGVAFCGDHHLDRLDLVRRADQALYQAKHLGKDTVT